MSDAIPTAKQNFRGIITGLFPWLTGFVAVGAGAAKGLAIRTASGLLHLAGGPDDPAAFRTGDKSGGCTVDTFPAGPAGTSLVFTNANGQTCTIPIVYAAGVVTVGPAVLVPPTPAPFEFVEVAGAGSSKVTIA